MKMPVSCVCILIAVCSPSCQPKAPSTPVSKSVPEGKSPEINWSELLKRTDKYVPVLEEDFTYKYGVNLELEEKHGQSTYGYRAQGWKKTLDDATRRNLVLATSTEKAWTEPEPSWGNQQDEYALYDASGQLMGVLNLFEDQNWCGVILSVGFKAMPELEKLITIETDNRGKFAIAEITTEQHKVLKESLAAKFK